MKVYYFLSWYWNDEKDNTLRHCRDNFVIDDPMTQIRRYANRSSALAYAKRNKMVCWEHVDGWVNMIYNPRDGRV